MHSEKSAISLSLKGCLSNQRLARNLNVETAVFTRAGSMQADFRALSALGEERNCLTDSKLRWRARLAAVLNDALGHLSPQEFQH
jgi:hypothetical protein